MSARIRITKRTVDRLVGEGAEHFYWDHALPGFGLRIRASGRKFYVAQFRANGRLRRVTLGPHGALSPDVARQRARELISEAKAGRDPTSRREAERKAVTMADVADRFLDEYVSVHCKPGTAYEYRRLLDHHIRPKLGDRHVADVQRSDIAALHHAARKAPYQANRLLSVLSKSSICGTLGRVRWSNPCRHVGGTRRSRANGSTQKSSNGSEGALTRSSEEGSETRSAVVAIRLLMLTGCRRSEIQKLRWEHVDLNAGELQLIDSKTGGRTVPLSPSAVRLLASLPREDDNPWVIVGRKRGAHLTDLEYPWRRIRARAGLHDVRIHDLRHSFASRALALGEGLPMIGKLLGHTQVQTTARYAHLARDTMKVSAARIGDSIDCDLETDGEVAERPAA